MTGEVFDAEFCHACKIPRQRSQARTCWPHLSFPGRIKLCYKVLNPVVDEGSTRMV